MSDLLDENKPSVKQTCTPYFDMHGNKVDSTPPGDTVKMPKEAYDLLVARVKELEAEVKADNETLTYSRKVLQEAGLRIAKLEEIISDFMTTKEDLQTWREEMSLTIDEQLSEVA